MKKIKVDSAIISTVLQIIVIILLFVVERNYDMYNFKNYQRLDLVKMNSRIIFKCQKNVSDICDDLLKNDLIEFRSFYDGVSILLDDKEIQNIFAKIDNNINNILEYDVCESELLADNLIQLNYALFKPFL